jgi:DNA-binding transcriptional regulator YhcF (GntR family)
MIKNGHQTIVNGASTLQQQIVAQMQHAVEKQQYTVGQQIPSITEAMEQYGVSRVTVMQAYRHLQSRGIITSLPGKGFFVATENITTHHRIFVLFDEMTPYKEVLYNAMKQALDKQGVLDIYFHHYNSKVFESLVRQSIGSYTSYIIIPLQYEGLHDILSVIPAGKLFLADYGNKKTNSQYPSVCQDFANGMLQPLQQAIPLLKKYKRIFLLYGEPVNQSLMHINLEFLKGFHAFAKKVKQTCRAVKNTQPPKLHKGDACIVRNDDDLVKLVEEIHRKKLVVGKDIGIISHNDTPLKRIIAGGLTTISADFKQMGEQLIEMITTKNHTGNSIPAKLIVRNSL